LANGHLESGCGCADLSSVSAGGGESPSARGHPSGRRCRAFFLPLRR
jgi:hypothetical protein